MEILLGLAGPSCPLQDRAPLKRPGIGGALLLAHSMGCDGGFEKK